MWWRPSTQSDERKPADRSFASQVRNKVRWRQKKRRGKGQVEVCERGGNWTREPPNREKLHRSNPPPPPCYGGKREGEKRKAESGQSDSNRPPGRESTIQSSDKRAQSSRPRPQKPVFAHSHPTCRCASFLLSSTSNGPVVDQSETSIGWAA